MNCFIRSLFPLSQRRRSFGNEGNDPASADLTAGGEEQGLPIIHSRVLQLVSTCFAL